jgi:hypothetical protein
MVADPVPQGKALTRMGVIPGARGARTSDAQLRILRIYK